MGVVGGVLAHWVVGILGWEEVQLPIGYPATVTHDLGRKQKAMDPRLLGAGLTVGLGMGQSTYQCQEIEDNQCHHHRHQHQQGNTPARYNGGRRKGDIIH